MDEISAIDKQIKELSLKKAELEATEARLRALPPEARLAIRMHNTMCTHNHTDGCGWYYYFRDGVPDFSPGNCTYYWLNRARYVIQEAKKVGITDADTIITIITALQNSSNQSYR